MFGQIEHHPIEDQFRRRAHNPFAAMVKYVDPLLLVNRERQRIYALPSKLRQGLLLATGPDCAEPRLQSGMIDHHHGPASHSHQMARSCRPIPRAETKLLDKGPIVAKTLDPTAQSIGNQDPLLVDKETARRAPLLPTITTCWQTRLDPPIDMKALHGSLPRSISHSYVYSVTIRRDCVRLVKHSGFITAAIATLRHRQT